MPITAARRFVAAATTRAPYHGGCAFEPSGIGRVRPGVECPDCARGIQWCKRGHEVRLALTPSPTTLPLPAVARTARRTVRIAPSSGWPSLHLAELFEFRDLVVFLAWRDIKVRYKQTLLGAAWAILQPVLTMVVFLSLIHISEPTRLLSISYA